MMVQQATSRIQSITAILLAVVSLQTVAAQDGQPEASILISIDQPLSAGRSYEITCRAVGWETPPNISWWLGDQRMSNTTEQVSDGGSGTVSTLSLRPTPDDNEKPLKCKAEGTRGVLEDTVILDVYFAPILQLDKPLDTEVVEGSDVRFRYIVRSNPFTYGDIWRYQGRDFEHNHCAGVYRLPFGHAAVRNIQRNEVGDYTFMAANVEGETESPPLRLRILYKPACSGPTERVLDVRRGETVSMLCDVDALPAADGYRWAFNRRVARVRFAVEGARFNHTVISDEQYGSFSCWARNSVGEQAQPCVFHVMPPGKPDPPSSCLVTNRASESVEVRCSAVYDGGYWQYFLLEAFDVASGRLLYNQSSLNAEFLVDELVPGQRLYLCLTTISARGRSQAVTLVAETFPDDTLEDAESEEASNCSVINRTSQSLMMVCRGGFDDGRIQSLLCEVLDSAAATLLAGSAPQHQTVMVSGLATDQQRRMRMMADSFNGQVAAVMMDVPLSDTKQVAIVEPLSTRILFGEQWLAANKSVDITCRTVGLQPPAYVTWWLGNQRLFDTTEQVSADGSETLSTVRLTPSRLDDGAMLTCRAENPFVPSSAQEHSIRLLVFFPPVVSLYIERPQRHNDIKEGDNVTLKCHALANPPVWKVKWMFQGRLLKEADSNGTLNETSTMSLHPIIRSHAGDYSCVVSNALGDIVSSPLRLTVQYQPTCRWQQPQVHTVARHEEVRLECGVDAVPSIVNYRWMFNSSMEADGATVAFMEWAYGGSQRTHKPVNDMDYGTFRCWAHNRLWLQQEPCVFHVVPPGRPNAPSNCSVLNVTAHSMAVRCAAATDGGRRQSYLLQVFDVSNGNVTFNGTQETPVFLVGHLWPNRRFTMRIAAVSSRGHSDWVRLDTATLNPPPTTTTTTTPSPEVQPRRASYNCRKWELIGVPIHVRHHA